MTFDSTEQFPRPETLNSTWLRAPKKSRRANYQSASRPETLRKQKLIRDLLSKLGEGLTVREVGNALGCSRQLALYHVKKMVACGQLVMILEPCSVNGGVRFRVWDELTLAAHYSTVLHAAVKGRGALQRELAHAA